MKEARNNIVFSISRNIPCDTWPTVQVQQMFIELMNELWDILWLKINRGPKVKLLLMKSAMVINQIT